MKEMDLVVLARDLPDCGLRVGDIGTIVFVHGACVGYEVEFMTLAGRTVAVRSLDEQYVRSVDADEVPHVRRLASLVEASKIAADRARVFARIVSDPGVRFGKVCLKGTRIDVATVIGALAAGDSAEAVERAHALTHEQILDALRYAFRVVAGLPTEAGEVP